MRPPGFSNMEKNCPICGGALTITANKRGVLIGRHANKPDGSKPECKFWGYFGRTAKPDSGGSKPAETPVQAPQKSDDKKPEGSNQGAKGKSIFGRINDALSKPIF